MAVPKVTVAIPTRNRMSLLMRAIDSVLAQSYQDFELLIIDNASTDATTSIPAVVRDQRLRYVRNPEDLGIIGNWNRCIDLASGEFLAIFHDDDVMYPTLIEKSVNALESHPTVGFTFPILRRVGLDGRFLNLWCEGYGASGLISGIRYLELTLEKERCISMAPSMVFRKAVHDTVGMYRQGYGFNSFDLYLFVQIALNYDAYFIDEVLFDYSIHEQQMSERHWRTPESPSGPISMLVELIGIVSALLCRGYADEPAKRTFLSSKLESINRRLIKYIAEEIPDI
jgi:glycosyltransferase involved in cell wall biosynthesis